jgi:hypothetical protein
MRTGTLWIGAVALLLAVACNRNDARTSTGQSGLGDQAKITLTGCLQSGEQGLASREPNSASRSDEGVDQFVLTNAKRPAADASAAPTGQLYILEGEKDELRQHVGQQVEVIGEPQEAKDANDASAQRIDVESVRMIAQNCSAQ